MRADFAYARARSLDEALDLLDEAARAGEEAKLIAGGQSLLPMMKLRLAAPQVVIDIAGLPELRGGGWMRSVAGGGLSYSIGALSTCCSTTSFRASTPPTSAKTRSSPASPPNAPGSLLGRLGPMLPQGYRIEHFDVELVGVFANTTPIGPYRGAGRPEAAYFTERLVDLLAAAMNLDPAELRRRNFIRPADFPYPTCTGLTYESGDYHAGLDLLLEKLDTGSPERLRLTPDGALLGRGIATFVEPGGIVPRVPGPDGTVGDKATVTVGPDGKVTVAVGTSGHGQGHETAFAQLACDLLGVPYDDVTVVFGDTDTAPFGYGTFGSRSLAAGGTAVYHACQAVLDAARRVDAPMPAAEAAARLGGISATGSSGAPQETYASGAYGCEVAVDQDTGQVTVTRVVAVDDCGVQVNPLLVEGQVHGAVAQGIGQALTEQVSYDENGQPVSASLMDYAVPFAATLPPIESYSVVTPSTVNPLGVKGMGESGTIGITPAVVNAVMDALAGYGIRHLDMPLTPEKIWTAVHRGPAAGPGN